MAEDLNSRLSVLESAPEEIHGHVYQKNLNPALVARRASAENRKLRIVSSSSGKRLAEDTARVMTLP